MLFSAAARGYSCPKEFLGVMCNVSENTPRQGNALSFMPAEYSEVHYTL